MKKMAAGQRKRVLLTRADNSALSELLLSRGFDVLDVPLIKIEYSADPDELDDIFGELGSYSWITFSSVHAVRGFFKAFFESFDDIRSIGLARIACVGESTARELQKYFLRADVVPRVQNSLEMAREMAEFETLDNLKMLAVRGDKGLRDYIKLLEGNFAAIVDEFVVYKNIPISPDPSSPPVADFKRFGADAVVFASPSAVENFAASAKLLSTDKNALRPKIITVGPTTSEAVKKFGMPVAKEAENPSPDCVAAAVSEVLR